MVIELVIPDKNLIIPDYDIDMSSGATAYDDYKPQKGHTKVGSDKSLSMSKEFGIYGYMSKILPQHIKNVYIQIGDNEYPSIKDYKKFTIKQLKAITTDMVGLKS